MVGVRRPSVFMPWPIARGRPSPQARPGLWQDAHEIKSEPDRRGSKNSVRPSSSRSVEGRLSSGWGTAAGRA